MTTFVPSSPTCGVTATTALGLDKLRQFSGALGLRHLDVPNLRGRVEPELEADRSEKAEPERGVDSDIPNQPESPGRAKPPAQIRRTHGRFSKTHRKRHGRDSNKAVKGKVLTGGLTSSGRKADDRCRPHRPVTGSDQKVDADREGGLIDAGWKSR
jgi:hypothetical protein